VSGAADCTGNYPFPNPTKDNPMNHARAAPSGGPVSTRDEDVDEMMHSATLPLAQLFLAVEQGLRGIDIYDLSVNPLANVQDRLWREDHFAVAAMYDGAMLGGLDLMSPPSSGDGCHGLRAERMAELRRPLPYRQRRGMTVAEIAAQSGMRRETLARLMEHHGYLEMVPYGGRQRRRLVTDVAFHAGLGHNVDASQIRIAAVEGVNRAGVFPVFYLECVPDILWTLDYFGIVAAAQDIPSKRERMRWLLDHHGYLPNDELAAIAGYSLSGVEKARSLSITSNPTSLRHP
jgi:hypothetical protein